MSAKRTVWVLGISFVVLLVLSLTPALWAQGKGEPAHPGTGTWACVDGAGNYAVSISSLANNGSGRSFTLDYNQMNLVDGMQAAGWGEGFMTGHDVFENYNVIYYRLADGSVVGVVITRGKGRVVDPDHLVIKSTAYVFYPGLFTDADGDGVPDNYMEAWPVLEGSMSCNRLSTALSSFPAPGEYPPKP